LAEQSNGKQFSGLMVSDALLGDGCDRGSILFTRDAGYQFTEIDDEMITKILLLA
jgi:hypothetical protein